MRLVSAILWLFISFSAHAESTTARFTAAPNTALMWLHPELHSVREQVLAAWGLKRSDDGKVYLEIPAQTGRAALASEKFGLAGDVLLKGTGLNPETTAEVAKIRYYPTTRIPKIGDGLYGMREAYADLINSSMLENAGIPVPKIRAIIQLDERHPTSGYRTAVMAREFINQTRLSNLYSMDSLEAQAELNRASQILYDKGITPHKLDIEELYFFLLRRMARTAARLQDLGFEHSYLHSQQFTLAGELADNGTGTWLADKGFQSYRGTDRPQYFKYDRQPTLALNMFIRAHGLTQDRIVRLTQSSDTLREQTHSLLGIVMRIDPELAERIKAQDPERAFWSFYKAELATIANQTTQTYSTKNLYSGSWEEFVSKGSSRLSASLNHKEAQQRFDELKDDWKVDALPDAVVIEELAKLSPMNCKALITGLHPEPRPSAFLR